MYDFLQGLVVEKSPTHVVLDVRGIGYFLRISVSTFSDLPTLDEEVRLLTHFVVREDVQQLFGFSTRDERELFRLLISVSGIGPKLAVTVLSGIPIAELKKAIVNGSVATLTSISGIGKKTAERLVVELKEKLVVEGVQVSEGAVAVMTAQDQKLEDSLRALISLGYRKTQAKTALDKVLKESDGGVLAVEDLIRASLKNI